MDEERSELSYIRRIMAPFKRVFLSWPDPAAFVLEALLCSRHIESAGSSLWRRGGQTGERSY